MFQCGGAITQDLKVIGLKPKGSNDIKFGDFVRTLSFVLLFSGILGLFWGLLVAVTTLAGLYATNKGAFEIFVNEVFIVLTVAFGPAMYAAKVSPINLIPTAVILFLCTPICERIKMKIMERLS
eukprot:TRINITY_DN8710_c0_g2_i3.p1 TRINITY_DN8710_c0_g2~~TRINITY_DN8710_c0_g2_i3.p1  ORF type:complete len:124 (-),score=37.74 TRINITY_DN8710_c0_g2_i3:121-492(-)